MFLITIAIQIIEYLAEDHTAIKLRLDHDLDLGECLRPPPILRTGE